MLLIERQQKKYPEVYKITTGKRLGRGKDNKVFKKIEIFEEI